MNNRLKSIQFGLIFLVASILFQDQIKAQEDIKQLPLHNLVFSNQEDSLLLMKNILDQGLQDINAQDQNGRTVLNFVTFLNRDPKIVQFLIDNKAKVNEPDLFNVTPLHNAIQKEETEIVQILLQAGADLYAKNDQGVTPIDLASQSENMKTILGLAEEKEIQK